MRAPRERQNGFKVRGALLIAAAVYLAVAGAPGARAGEKTILDAVAPRAPAGAVDAAELGRQRGGRLSPGGVAAGPREHDISVILWDEKRHRGALGSTSIQLGQSHPFSSSTGRQQ